MIINFFKFIDKLKQKNRYLYYYIKKINGVNSKDPDFKFINEKL